MAANKLDRNVCAAPNCANKVGKNNLSFFPFPRDLLRCKQWIVRAKADHLTPLTTFQISKHQKLCEKHFEGDQFTNNQWRDKLKPDAVPTIFDTSSSGSTGTSNGKPSVATPKVSTSTDTTEARVKSNPMPTILDSLALIPTNSSAIPTVSLTRIPVDGGSSKPPGSPKAHTPASTITGATDLTNAGTAKATANKRGRKAATATTDNARASTGKAAANSKTSIASKASTAKAADASTRKASTAKAATASTSKASTAKAATASTSKASTAKAATASASKASTAKAAAARRSADKAATPSANKASSAKTAAASKSKASTTKSATVSASKATVKTSTASARKTAAKTSAASTSKASTTRAATAHTLKTKTDAKDTTATSQSTATKRKADDGEKKPGRRNAKRLFTGNIDDLISQQFLISLQNMATKPRQSSTSANTPKIPQGNTHLVRVDISSGVKTVSATDTTSCVSVMAKGVKREVGAESTSNSVQTRVPVPAHLVEFAKRRETAVISRARSENKHLVSDLRNVPQSLLKPQFRILPHQNCDVCRLIREHNSKSGLTAEEKSKKEADLLKSRCVYCSKVHPQARMFGFPSDHIRFLKWKANCDYIDVSETSHQFLCAEHFNKKQFVDDPATSRLIASALPTVFFRDGAVKDPSTLPFQPEVETPTVKQASAQKVVSSSNKTSGDSLPVTIVEKVVSSSNKTSGDSLPVTTIEKVVSSSNKTSGDSLPVTTIESSPSEPEEVSEVRMDESSEVIPIPIIDLEQADADVPSATTFPAAPDVGASVTLSSNPPTVVPEPVVGTMAPFRKDVPRKRFINLQMTNKKGAAKDTSLLDDDSDDDDDMDTISNSPSTSTSKSKHRDSSLQTQVEALKGNHRHLISVLKSEHKNEVKLLKAQLNRMLSREKFALRTPTLDMVMNELSKLVPPPVYDLVRLKARSQAGHENHVFPQCVKDWACSIFRMSPNVYAKLQKTFTLPSAASVRNTARIARRKEILDQRILSGDTHDVTNDGNFAYHQYPIISVAGTNTDSPRTPLPDQRPPSSQRPLAIPTLGADALATKLSFLFQ